jgi:hypothetical protein
MTQVGGELDLFHSSHAARAPLRHFDTLQDDKPPRPLLDGSSPREKERVVILVVEKWAEDLVAEAS